MFILGNIFIIIGSYFFYKSFKSDIYKKVILNQIISIILFNLGVLFFGSLSLTGSIIFIYSIFLLFISLFNLNFIKNVLSLSIFIFGPILSYYTGFNYDSTLIIIGSLFGTLAILFKTNMFYMKFFYFFSNITYLLFDIYIQSPAAIFFDLIGFYGLIIYFRSNLTKK